MTEPATPGSTPRSMAHVTLMAEAESTQDELRRSWATAEGALATGTTIATWTQTAGRGRHGREWVAPADKCLAMSVLLITDGSPEARANLHWLTLTAGLAVCEELQELAAARGATLHTALKWPNDVLLNGGKVSGILGEVLEPMGGQVAVSIGIGVNVDLDADALPAPRATSLALAGLELTAEDRAELPKRIASRLLQRFEALVARRWDAGAAGLVSEFSEACDTIGQRVRATLPSAEAIVGLATGIDGQGRLVIAEEPNGMEVAVTAGDVERLRPADAE